MFGSSGMLRRPSNPADTARGRLSCFVRRRDQRRAEGLPCACGLKDYDQRMKAKEKNKNKNKN